MSEKKKVLIVGGLPFNIPNELRDLFQVVKHVEEGTSRLADLPAVDYVFVMSDFASHKMLQVVKDRANVPIVYLRKGWASMKEELIERCLLPQGHLAAGAKAQIAKDPETGTLSGLSEDELWKTYKPKFIEAVKGALKPRELVSEADLLEALALVGVPAEDCRLVLPRLQMGGVVDSPKEGFWRSLISQAGFDFGDGSLEPAAAPQKRTRSSSSFNMDRKEEADARARRLRGLPMGPYPSKRAILREMLKYEEWNPGGVPARENALKRAIERAIILRVIDDTHENLLVDHDPLMGLKKLVKNGAQEEVPVPLPIPEKDIWELELERRRAATQADIATLKGRWPEVVQAVKREKKMVGTILESCRIQWIDEERIAVCLVPAEFTMYRLTLEATENWGFVTKVARELLGQDFVVRFLMENRLSR